MHAAAARARSKDSQPDALQAISRLDRQIEAWAGRWTIRLDSLATSLKPGLDHLSCLALARALGVNLPKSLKAAKPDAVQIRNILEMLQYNQADAQLLPVILSLARRNDLLPFREARNAAEEFGLADLTPLGTDLLMILTVEVPKIDVGITTPARALFLGTYARTVLTAPHRLHPGDLASGYLLTHLVFFATGFGKVPARLGRLQQIASSLERVAWLALEIGYFDLLAEAIIGLKILGHDDLIDPDWMSALEANVSTEGWAYDARYPIGMETGLSDDQRFLATYHCTLVTRLALGVMPCDPAPRNLVPIAAKPRLANS